MYLENYTLKKSIEKSDFKELKAKQEHDTVKNHCKVLNRDNPANAGFSRCSANRTEKKETSRHPRLKRLIETNSKNPRKNQEPTTHLYNAMYKCRSSEQERRVDALALRADERRDKLRKASGRSKYPLIRRYLNGETWLSNPQSTYGEYIAIRWEPGELKHLSSRRKRKKNRFPK